MHSDFEKIKFEVLSVKTPVGTFDCDDEDLNDFLQNDALQSQKEKLTQTTCAVHNNEVIGFFTVACDSIRFEKREKRKLFSFGKRIYDTYPAIMLARMGVAKHSHKKGLGSLFIEIVKSLVWKLNTDGIGCRFVTLDAYENAADFYAKNGFVENIAQVKSSGTISMRFDILRNAT